MGVREGCVGWKGGGIEQRGPNGYRCIQGECVSDLGGKGSHKGGQGAWSRGVESGRNYVGRC